MWLNHVLSLTTFLFQHFLFPTLPCPHHPFQGNNCVLLLLFYLLCLCNPKLILNSVLRCKYFITFKYVKSNKTNRKIYRHLSGLLTCFCLEWLFQACYIAISLRTVFIYFIMSWIGALVPWIPYHPLSFFVPYFGKNIPRYLDK